MKKPADTKMPPPSKGKKMPGKESPPMKTADKMMKGPKK